MSNMTEYIITDVQISDNNVKSAPDQLAAEGEMSVRDVKHIFDRLPELIAQKFNGFITAVITKFADYYTKAEAEAVMDQKVAHMTGGGMSTYVYDTNNDGIVDDAEKLCGYTVEHFATAEQAQQIAQTAGAAMPKSAFVLDGTTLTITY